MIAMNQQQLEQVLRDTLADYHLSGSEKQALKAVLADQALDEQQSAFLRNLAFELARQALDHPDAANVLGWLEDVNKLLQPQTSTETAAEEEAWFSPNNDCPARIVQLFDRTQRSVDVCVYTITDDRISGAIIRAKERGVTVRIITDVEKAFDLGSDIERLGAVGIPVRVDRTVTHMHHKFAIFDEAMLLTGSYNWTRGAARDNRENFVISSSKRLVGSFLKIFTELWEELK